MNCSSRTTAAMALVAGLIAATPLATQDMPEPAEAGQDEGPAHHTRVNWAYLPIAQMPSADFTQVRISCVIAPQDQVRNCRLIRQLPERSRFGQNLVRRMHRARLEPGFGRPGDTITFDLWLCGPTAAATLNCRPELWPHDQ